MPMLLTGRTRDHIPWPNLFDRTAPSLDPTRARGHDQRLTEGMRMPVAAGARLERDAGARRTRWISRLEQRGDADRAGEVFRRSSAGRLGAVSVDFHCRSPPGKLHC